eukprot:CAMPEP_0184378242 /NCGR_PEP_ID=MMETSP0007-20130409/2905_1 /TAXON_ID=97485 /ORGANISM="Prymnesium parvum, Strain Texoma1" /LENGTH=44 /DNA_ID= /DNA_START= /DNA_END= /DNA_ORIENTATION=
MACPNFHVCMSDGRRGRDASIGWSQDFHTRQQSLIRLSSGQRRE